MDFRKPDSFEKIFLELDPDSESDSDSDSDSYSHSPVDFNTIFDSNSLSDKLLSDKLLSDKLLSDKLLSDKLLSDNKPTKVSPIQELLTHISSPKSNEEFIMPFQDYSLDKQPVIKIVHKPRSKSTSKRRNSSHKNFRVNSHKSKHHNYPSTRKSSKRRRTSSRLNRAIPKYI
jgi:hypothetical protein